MKAILIVFGIVILIGVVRGTIQALWNIHKEPDMDENGDLRCKKCGCRNFAYEKESDGATRCTCARCGYSWHLY